MATNTWLPNYYTSSNSNAAYFTHAPQQQAIQQQSWQHVHFQQLAQVQQAAPLPKPKKKETLESWLDSEIERVRVAV